MSTHFAHAYIKGIDSMPRKTSIVASLVRDRYVADAIVILEHTPRRAARPVLKAILRQFALLAFQSPQVHVFVALFLHHAVALFLSKKSPATSLLK